MENLGNCTLNNIKKEDHPIVYIEDFYKKLSDKLKGKYSPEELELIGEVEKNLTIELLRTNELVETKSIAYTVEYFPNMTVKPVLHSDFNKI